MARRNTKKDQNTPKNTTVIDAPIKKPSSTIVFAENLTNSDDDEKESKKTSTKSKKDDKSFWGLFNIGKKKKTVQTPLTNEEKESIKTPDGISMIDNFDDSSSLEQTVEDSLKSKFFPNKQKKKKVSPDTVVQERINKAQRFNPDPKIGLSDAQVNQRIQENLTNNTKKKYTKSYWEIIKDNVFTFFNIFLLVLAICLITVGEWKNCTFLVIMIANILIGIIQEIRSKKTVEKLKLVTAPSTTVLRNGKELKIPPENIVLDDIMSLAVGNQIPADAIIVDGSIEVNESLLTGESLPVKKHVGDTIYAGSFVTSGAALAKVNKIAEANWAISLQNQAKRYQKPRSELLRSLNQIIKVISILIVPVAACLLFIGAMNSPATTSFEKFHDAVLNASGPIIGSVPAGMFLLTSVALAVGVVNMSKKKTLVQDLYCFEMLARTNVLCLDKTGTLTDGTMEVSEVIVIDKNVELDTVMGSYLSTFKESNQTSLALSQRFNLNGKLKVVGKIPFSSSRKYSAVSFAEKGTFILGAPEFVYRSDNKGLIKIISERQKMGYRVVMLAHSNDYIDSTGEVTGDVLPIALFVLLDHVREEAPETIKWFNENGVKIKIISGDNPLTAAEIAGVCGVPDYQKAVSLDGLSLEETAAIADKYTVFGRVSPEQKAILIKALKSKGKTVAMTGDGVNDILAMKQSDCSVAMASGADAAKNVAHLVLLDSNFASMPAVVLEGRRVINNIQRSSALYLMKTIFTFFMAFTFIILGFATMGMPSNQQIIYPFLPGDILLMEFVGIGVPSVLLALQPDNSQIKGHFIRNTFSEAIPGALVILITVACTFTLGQLGFFNDSSIEGFANMEMPWFTATQKSIGGNAIRTLAGLGMTFASLSVLFALSQPFNTYRFSVFIGSWILAIIVIFGIIPYAPFNKFFFTNYTNFYGNKSMILMAIIYAIGCPLITSGIMKIFSFMTKGALSPTETPTN